MRQAMLSLAALCMITALCAQLMHASHYRFSIRMVLGLEIFRLLLSLVGGAFTTLD